MCPAPQGIPCPEHICQQGRAEERALQGDGEELLCKMYLGQPLRFVFHR